LLFLTTAALCFDAIKLKNEFVRKWFDYIAFALSGEDSAHTQAAPVAYMMSDLHKPGAELDYPMGGMESIVRALVKGLENHNGELRLNSRVERLLLEDRDGVGACVGVELADGKKILAKKGVVSNASLWNLARLAHDSAPDDTSPDSPLAKSIQQMQDQANAMHMTRSFMHLHLGIPKNDIPDDLECHHSVLDFSRDVRDEQNMVIISIPTVFDPSLAPEGYHIVHAYTAASDSFDDWLPFLDGNVEDGRLGASPNSISSAKYRQQDGYSKLKEEKAEALWKAVECVIPDIRERAKRKGSLVMIGTPLTHRRYNSRFRGTYGPGPGPNQQLWDLAGATTKIKGLLLCGDTTFPGIGLPAVAASGSIAANTLVSVWDQLRLIEELKSGGALQ
jgi:phytoene dehydrogenase-like protein